MLQFNPPHPGAFIKRTYLEPYGVRSVDVANNLKVSSSTFSRLINEKSAVSSILALKLSKVLGRSPESWLAMQRNYDLWKAKQHYIGRVTNP
ncbi:MAG: addiction module antidote protein, HigA family [Cellvibrio sp. 79]|nr:MAG: addiction module antidote protein, HigA family [Cellvibrio sp. 79]